jgi:hypothetical protein
LDPNGSTLGTANDQTRHAVKFSAGFRREFFRDAETRIDLFGEWRQGRRFSYTFDSLASGGRDPVFGVFGNDDRHLIYVPTAGGDSRVSFANAAAESAFNALVDGSPLRRFRGSIAGKNVGRSPNFTKIDLRIAQDIPTFGFGKVKLFADMENVLNFIDSDLGTLRQVRFPYTAAVADVQCLVAPVATGTAPAANQIAANSTQACAQYRYSNVRNPNEDLFTRVSLWAVRVGVRFEF